MTRKKKPTPELADTTPPPAPAFRFVVLPNPTIRLEVFVEREAVAQWVITWPRANVARGTGGNRTHLDVARALLRFHRWRRSLERASPRARHTNAQGVRLWIGGELVAAFASDPDLALLPPRGTRASMPPSPAPAAPPPPRKRKSR